MLRKGLAVIVILLFIGVAFAPSINALDLKSTRVNGNIIYVDDDNTEGPWDGTLEHPFNKVEDGIQATEDGYTVYVFNGYYREGGIDIRNSIKLNGQKRESTIIDANGHFYGFKTCTDRITISNITIKGTDWFEKIFSSAIALISNECIISDNIISYNSCYGIWIYTAKYNVISNNIIKYNDDSGIWFTGGRETSFNFFYKNHIIRNGDGVEIDCSPGLNFFRKNNFIDNSRNAYFRDSFYNHWSGNYWDDWDGRGPYTIFGKNIRYTVAGVIVRDWKNFDWRPAQEPYDI